MVWQFLPTKRRLISRLDIQPPRPLPERHGVALVVIAKNEERYVSDWLAFHSLAGVREVILYDHGSTDATPQIARSFKGLNVSIIPWQMDASVPRRRQILHRQVLAYCHAICAFGSKFRWMGFIDMDEFIVPRVHKTIPEALASVTEFANVSLPWVMFGHSGNADIPGAAVPFAYRRRADDSVSGILKFKCIVDPCTVTQVGVHMFLTNEMGNRTSNMLGRTVPYKRRNQEGFAVNDILQLNHYYLKSVAETEHKIRSSAVSGMDPERREESIRRNARLIESNTIEDNAAVVFLSRHGIFSSDEFRWRYRS